MHPYGGGRLGPRRAGQGVPLSNHRWRGGPGGEAPASAGMAGLLFHGVQELAAGLLAANRCRPFGRTKRGKPLLPMLAPYFGVGGYGQVAFGAGGGFLVGPGRQWHRQTRFRVPGRRHAGPGSWPQGPGAGPTLLRGVRCGRGPFAALGGQDVGAAGFGVTRAQVVLELAGQHGVVAMAEQLMTKVRAGAVVTKSCAAVTAVWHLARTASDCQCRYPLGQIRLRLSSASGMGPG